MSESQAGVTEVARDYYNSADADAFYFKIWGGEDIHVGIYETPDEPIKDASVRSVGQMAAKLEGLGADKKLIDVGAGYGGGARWLVDRFGCHVTCLNLSEVQNERNRAFNKERGIENKVDVIDGAFEEIPCPDLSFDYAWSQDAVLHSGEKPKVFSEVARVLKPGARFVMTDPMQADDCPEGVLDAVLARIHLDHLGSFALYSRLGERAGLRLVEKVDLSEQLTRHYSRVREELLSKRAQLDDVSKDYLDRMTEGLGHWVEAGEKGYLAWGILLFEKTG